MLLNAELSWETREGTGEWRESLVQRWTAEPGLLNRAAAEVGACRERAYIAAWVEEIFSADRTGEPRRVSILLDRLVRHLMALGRSDEGRVVAATRIVFLRTGTLSRDQLNLLRRLAR